MVHPIKPAPFAPFRIIVMIATVGVLFSMRNILGTALTAYAAAPTATPAPGKEVLRDEAVPGEQKIGEINATYGEYRYEIEAKAGDQVLTGITGEDGFSPALEIRAGASDKRGSTLGRATSDPQTTGSLLLNYTLSKDGTYTLVVSAGPSKGRKTGRFVMTFGLVTFKKAVNGIAMGDVLPTNGFPIVGTIKGTVSQILYKITAKAGDKVDINARGYFGLVPAVAIRAGDYADKSKQLATEEGKAGVTLPNVELIFDIPEDGTYIITASHAGFENGKTTGQFTISLNINDATPQDVLEPTDFFTQPSVMPATIAITGDPASIVGKLHDSGLVPEGGEQVANLIHNIFQKASTSGVWSMTLGAQGDVSARNFVANIEMVWTQSGVQSGCGVGFWSASDTEYAGAFVTNDKTAFMYQSAGTANPISYTDFSNLFTPGQVSTITLIVIGNRVSMYINGTLQTTKVGKSKYGAINALLYNTDDNKKLTLCTYPSGWVWRF